MTRLLATFSRLAIAAGLLGSVAPAWAGANAGLRFQSVVVDTTPLAQAGLSGYAARLKAAATPAVQAAFADRLSPGDRRAPVLVVRVDRLNLDEFAGMGRGTSGGGFGANPDDIQGAGLVVQGGRVVDTLPIRTTSNGAVYAGSNTHLNNESIRAVYAVQTLAYWIKQKL